MQRPDSIYESGTYLESNPDWHAEDAPFKARWIAAILARQAIAPKHLVEIGCGSGEILVELAKVFPAARIEGYDISPQAMAIAGPKAREGLAFHQADYLAAQTDRPDVLMAIDVFEHVEDYIGFIRAMQPRAEWKVFHIPLDLSAQGLLFGRGIMHARRVVGHLHYFCKDTALATLADCGYEVVAWNYTHGAETLPNRALRTRLANLPRRLLRAVNEDFAVRAMGGASMMVLAR
jgi:SAM-dependent methyltransferase